MMIQKRKRTIGRERREPERETPDLNCHRIAIDAEQATLCDRASEAGSVESVQIASGKVTRLDERRFVRSCQVAAGCNEKRAAPHCWVEDAQSENRLR